MVSVSLMGPSDLGQVQVVDWSKARASLWSAAWHVGAVLDVTVCVVGAMVMPGFISSYQGG